MVSKKEMHYLCEGEIVKAVTQDCCLSSLGKSRNAKAHNVKALQSYPTLTLIIYSYNLQREKHTY